MIEQPEVSTLVVQIIVAPRGTGLRAEAVEGTAVDELRKVRPWEGWVRGLVRGIGAGLRCRVGRRRTFWEQGRVRVRGR